MLAVKDLEYELPEELVATHPATPRDAARLMVLRRSEPASIEHAHVRDLPGFLDPGDLLVVNTTKVVPARLVGVRSDTRGKAEGLFLGGAEESGGAAPAWGSSHEGGEFWRVMLKARRLREGVCVDLHMPGGGDSGLRLTLIERVTGEGEEGAWVVRVDGLRPGQSSLDALAAVGTTPLPPYIRAARKRHQESDASGTDPDRYQTVYARGSAGGSVAAPTAGLHFTGELLDRLGARGVERAEVTLHVGAGTFKPVETEFVEQHRIHAEWCEVPAMTGAAIERARTRAAGGHGVSGSRANGRVVAVGTTTARTLESFEPAELAAGAAKWTSLMITPGHAWRNADALLTNFHLPRSTLLALVASLLPEGPARLMEVYRRAIEDRYRFYSFGDAMLILP